MPRAQSLGDDRLVVLVASVFRERVVEPTEVGVDQDEGAELVAKTQRGLLIERAQLRAQQIGAGIAEDMKGQLLGCGVAGHDTSLFFAPANESLEGCKRSCVQASMAVGVLGKPDQSFLVPGEEAMAQSPRRSRECGVGRDRRCARRRAPAECGAFDWRGARGCRGCWVARVRRA